MSPTYVNSYLNCGFYCHSVCAKCIIVHLYTVKVLNVISFLYCNFWLWVQLTCAQFHYHSFSGVSQFWPWKWIELLWGGKKPGWIWRGKGVKVIKYALYITDQADHSRLCGPADIFDTTAASAIHTHPHWLLGLKEMQMERKKCNGLSSFVLQCRTSSTSCS